MIRSLTAGLAFVLALTGFSLAADDPIATRKALMRASGAAAKVSGGMMKGELPFDADVAALALAALNSTAVSVGSFFPEGSEKGDTKASPNIWTDMGGFEAAAAKFKQDTAAAVAAKPADLDAFKAAMGPVFGNCKGCHEKYQISK